MLQSDFSQTLYIILVCVAPVVILIFFVQCGWLRRRWLGQPSPDRGLAEKVMRSLPKFKFNSSSGGGAAAECAICLAEYADGEEVTELPQCGHVFHTECVDTWLSSHSSCPTCRQVFVEVKAPFCNC